MENERLNNIIEMISAMARLDFSQRLENEISNDNTTIRSDANGTNV